MSMDFEEINTDKSRFDQTSVFIESSSQPPVNHATNPLLDNSCIKPIDNSNTDVTRQ